MSENEQQKQQQEEQEEKKQPGSGAKVTKIEKGGSDEYKIVFQAPFKFEGKQYKELDLNGLKDLTGADMKAVEDILSNSGSNPISFEFSLSGAWQIAAKVTGLPYEFFEQLPAKEAVKVKNIILVFFTG